jgi:dTDP-4-amino-4,6-dideoxygalactose transaminase
MKHKFFSSFDKNEFNAVSKVMKSGKLSGFVAAKDGFYGGKNVRLFEKKLANYFNVKYAVTFNSWTSGLIASIGALDIEPGDEVIVPTWTMCATATCIIHWNAIPVFVDINIDDYTLCIKDLKKKISKKTKVIISVDIFGYPSNIKEIQKIAKKNKIKVLYDSAQSIGAKYKNKLLGSFGDISGLSFNYHKHIHTGEGGVCFTNKKIFYEKLALIRNHGEILIKSNKKEKLSNIIGYNFRLGELECAIGIEQLKKLKRLVNYRIEKAEFIFNQLKKLNGLLLPKINRNIEPSYYTLPLRLSDKILKKVNRNVIIRKLIRNGAFGVSAGYMNLHLMKMYQNKIAYGKKNFPWSLSKNKLKVNYLKGICPNAEKCHSKSFIALSPFSYQLNNEKIKKLINSFKKTWENLSLNDLSN